MHVQPLAMSFLSSLTLGNHTRSFDPQKRNMIVNTRGTGAAVPCLLEIDKMRHEARVTQGISNRVELD